MTPNASQIIGQAICRALDLDPDSVTSLTLTLVPRESALLEVGWRVDDSWVAFQSDVAPVLSQFHLVPKESAGS